MADLKTYATTKAALISVPTPVDTRTYRAFGHNQLVDLTLEGIEKSGFKLDNEYYTMAREGNVANGRYTIRDVADSEMQIQVGWQNSLNKSISLKWALGVRIFICSNGAISGDMGAFKKKHQGGIQEYTPHAISEYIKTAGDVFLNMQKERDAMKQVEVSKRTVAELVGRMYLEDEIIESTQLNIIKRELDHPTFDYGAPGSLWELFNFTTYALKEVHPTLWMDTHINTHAFFVNAAGILIENKPLIVLPSEGERIAANQLDLFNETIMI